MFGCNARGLSIRLWQERHQVIWSKIQCVFLSQFTIISYCEVIELRSNMPTAGLPLVNRLEVKAEAVPLTQHLPWTSAPAGIYSTSWWFLSNTGKHGNGVDKNFFILSQTMFHLKKWICIYIYSRCIYILLYIIYHISYILYYILYIIYHISYVTYHISYIKYHILYIIHYVLYIIHYTLYIMYCT